LEIIAEFDLGEPNFKVLRKVSACDDDWHFSKTLQYMCVENVCRTLVSWECL
jgi:hypothetical protein